MANPFKKKQDPMNTEFDSRTRKCQVCGKLKYEDQFVQKEGVEICKACETSFRSLSDFKKEKPKPGSEEDDLSTQ